MKKILISTTFLTLLAIIAYGYHHSQKQVRRPIIDSQQLHVNKLALKKEPAPKLLAPDFVLTDVNGNKFQLSDYKGHIIVLNYWATYCKACVDEIPDFMKLRAEFKNEGVVFAGISCSLNKGEDVRAFAKRININYPLMRDKNNIFDR